MPAPPRTSRWSPALRSCLLGLLLAVLVGAAAWSEATDAVVTATVVTVLALAAGLGAAWAAARLVPRPGLAPLGGVLGTVALALLGVTPRGAITVLEAGVLGVGVGLVSPRADGVARSQPLLALVPSACVLAVPALVLGRTGAFRAGAVVLVGAAGMAWRDRVDGRRRAGVAGRVVVGTATVLAVGLGAWVPANDPTVAWYGHLTTHGDRRGDQVAITFDDGPDAEWTLRVAGMLDEHGVKGTFFEVGKAIDARPDLARALYDDGHLLGNHSYRHDYTGWLDPRYPELGETQAAFDRAIGACPALFRPPHGQRTPFMLAHVADRGMHTVTWDVSARDWTDTDGHRVAQRILDAVRPGSIILLHDGLDGKVHADRHVLEQALPEILDGLAAKGLHPVRLDALLGVDGYLPHC